MVKSRERNLREIQLSLCVLLRLQSYSCFIAAWCREEKQRERERGREKLGGVEKEKKRGRKKNKREKEQAALVFCHTPSGFLCYL